MVEGKNTHLGDHIQTLDWMMEELDKARQKFSELSKQRRNREINSGEAKYLSDCAYEAWLKAEKYFKLADDVPFYYAAVILNPTLKTSWFNEAWGNHDEKRDWIAPVIDQVRQMWQEDYKWRKISEQQSTPQAQHQKKRIYSSAYNYKRLRITTEDTEPGPLVDQFEDYLEKDVIYYQVDEFDVISYWKERLNGSQAQLAQFALDVFSIPPMSDECERVFSSCKILLNQRRTRLLMEIVEANECLRHWYGPPGKDEFDNKDLERPVRPSLDDDDFNDKWENFVKGRAQQDAEAIALEQVGETTLDQLDEDELDALEEDIDEEDIEFCGLG